MQHSRRSVRTAAVAALVVGLALLAPGTALAGTTEPTPTTTTATTPDPTTTTAPSTTTAPPTSSTTTTTTSGTPSTTASTKAPASNRSTVAKASGKTVPFGHRASRLAAALPGGSSAQAGYAAGYLAHVLADNGHWLGYPHPYQDSFDGGNTADAIIGLDAAKVGADEADASLDYLESNVGSYVGTAFESAYAGPLAKVAITAETHGADPTAFGGLDLIDELDQSLGIVEPGRYSDRPVDCGDEDPDTTCDYSNTIGQSLAIIAVGRATGEVPEDAVQFLLDQQCDDGGFRGVLGADDCTSDVDATAFAAQALLGAGEDDAANAALDFLATRQQSNGGLINQDGQVNANTTAVAAQAFAAAGLAEELGAAQEFLASLQMDCSFAPALRGGIAFTAADYAGLKSTPNDVDAQDRAIRATPQSTLALAGGSLLDVTVVGSSAVVPTVSCPSASTTTTPAATTSPTDPPAASAVPDELAFTGSNAVAMTALGLLLVGCGGAAIILARRKGAHA